MQHLNIEKSGNFLKGRHEISKWPQRDTKGTEQKREAEPD